MSLLRLYKKIFANTNLNLLSLEHYNWFGFDSDVVKRLIEDSGCTYHKYDINKALSFRSEGHGSYYKDINLDEVIKYTVCNELELMPTQIDITLDEHLHVVEKWRAVARSCVDYTLATIQQNKITKILIPQGYLIEAAVCRMLANKMGLSILSIENSLSKDRLLWDNVSGITVNYNLGKNHYWKYREIIERKAADDFVEAYLENITLHKTAEHTSPRAKLDISNNKKTILFLGQVYIDSSVLFNLYGFRDPVEIIEILCEYCIKNDYNLLVKLHPKEVSGNTIVNKPLDKLTWRKLLDSQAFTSRYLGNDSIIIDKDNVYDTYGLISLSDVCVTITSMSGLEACLMKKQVINCGYSSYAGLGFTSEAADKALLLYFLDKLVKGDDNCLNDSDINMFFYIYLMLFCIEKSEPALAHVLLNK